MESLYHKKEQPAQNARLFFLQYDYFLIHPSVSGKSAPMYFLNDLHDIEVVDQNVSGQKQACNSCNHNQDVTIFFLDSTFLFISIFLSNIR